MSLSSTQLAVLNQHANAGNRIAYYEALASFGVLYGELALGVVRNDTVSCDAANNYFAAVAEDEGVDVTHKRIDFASDDHYLASTKSEGVKTIHCLASA